MTIDRTRKFTRRSVAALALGGVLMASTAGLALADTPDAGVQGGQEMATRLEGNECRAAKSCIVLELQGALTTPNGLDQSHGFSKTLASLAPDVQIVQRPTEWTADVAADAAQNVLTQNPDLAGIFGASELMATAINAQL